MPLIGRCKRRDIVWHRHLLFNVNRVLPITFWCPSFWPLVLFLEMLSFTNVWNEWSSKLRSHFRKHVSDKKRNLATSQLHEIQVHIKMKCFKWFDSHSSSLLIIFSFQINLTFICYKDNCYYSHHFIHKWNQVWPFFLGDLNQGYAIVVKKTLIS